MRGVLQDLVGRSGLHDTAVVTQQEVGARVKSWHGELPKRG